MYLFLAALSLSCSLWDIGCGTWDPVVRGKLFILVQASLVVVQAPETGSIIAAGWLSSCSLWAQQLPGLGLVAHSMWDLSYLTRLELMSPELEDRSLTTDHQGSPSFSTLKTPFNCSQASVL